MRENYIYPNTGLFSSRRFLRDFLPDFCWQSMFEILTMVEQVDEDISYESLKVIVSQMKISGEIFARDITLKSGRSSYNMRPVAPLRYEYIRNTVSA